jgi:hypothetical protein
MRLHKLVAWLRFEARQNIRKSNSGGALVGAAIVLAIVAGALFLDLAIVSPVGSRHHAIGLAPASAALNTPTWGKVLVAGGAPAFGLGVSTELYDPATNTFAPAADTASMNAARLYVTATLLPSGKVLIAGGFSFPSSSPLSSTELYDPATNSFAAAADTASMNAARISATATHLPSGKVLIAGGSNGGATTELYDPATNSFAAAADTARMNAARFYATETLLPSGKALIAGGIGADFLSSTELYDPATNTFAAAADTASMNVARYYATATRLPSGKVLIAGGHDTFSSILSSTELYDPATNSFAAAADTASMNVARSQAVATRLPSGKVLIAGGADASGSSVLSSTELYDPATNSFAAAADTASMNVGREFATATLLPSGKVLIAGIGASYLSSTELYDPATNTFAAAADTASMNESRFFAAAILLPFTKNACKKGGWSRFKSPSFKNEGQCVSFANH